MNGHMSEERRPELLRSESLKSRIYLFVFGLTVNTDMLKTAPELADIPWMSVSLKWVLLLKIRSTASERTVEVLFKVSFFINLSATYIVTDTVDGAGESVCLAQRFRAACSLCAIILW